MWQIACQVSYKNSSDRDQASLEVLLNSVEGREATESTNVSVWSDRDNRTLFFRDTVDFVSILRLCKSVCSHFCQSLDTEWDLCPLKAFL